MWNAVIKREVLTRSTPNAADKFGKHWKHRVRRPDSRSTNGYRLETRQSRRSGAIGEKDSHVHMQVMNIITSCQAYGSFFFGVGVLPPLRASSLETSEEKGRS